MPLVWTGPTIDWTEDDGRGSLSLDNRGEPILLVGTGSRSTIALRDSSPSSCRAVRAQARALFDSCFVTQVDSRSLAHYAGSEIPLLPNAGSGAHAGNANICG